jgi:hypothetical protein
LRRSAGNSGWVQPCTLALAAIFLIGLFSTPVTDSDFWWHIKTGQYILEHLRLPVPDPLSYTTYSGPAASPGEAGIRTFNLTHEWLAQAGMYAVYSRIGPPGVIFARALLLTLFCAITGFLAARRSGGVSGGLAAAFAAASIATLFTADRPPLLTFCLTAIFIVILETRKALWLLPLLALVWANCHGGFFMGWLVLGAYSLEPLIRRKKGTGREDWRLWIIAGSSILISGLNPNHFGVIATLLQYRRSALTSTLVEWTLPYLWGPPYIFDLLLYAAAIVLLISWRRVRVIDWLLFAAFAAAALSAFRNILFIALVAPMLIASYFPWKIRMPSILAIAAPLLILAGLIAGCVDGRFFQYRVADWRFPRRAADFLLSHAAGARLFNTYEQGGYLMWRLWPRRQVFIDGRALNEFVYEDYRKILYNFGSSPNQMTPPRSELLERYSVDSIVMNSFEYVTGTVYPLALALGNPEVAEWKLAYEDPQSLVFLRNLPPGVEEIPKARRVIDHMEAECALHVQYEPDEPICARTLAELSLWAGDKERARRMLGLYLAHRTEPDPAVEQMRHQLSTQ